MELFIVVFIVALAVCFVGIKLYRQLTAKEGCVGGCSCEGSPKPDQCHDEKAAWRNSILKE